MSLSSQTRKESPNPTSTITSDTAPKRLLFLRCTRSGARGHNPSHPTQTDRNPGVPSQTPLTTMTKVRPTKNPEVNQTKTRPSSSSLDPSSHSEVRGFVARTVHITVIDLLGVRGSVIRDHNHHRRWSTCPVRSPKVHLEHVHPRSSSPPSSNLPGQESEDSPHVSTVSTTWPVSPRVWTAVRTGDGLPKDPHKI